jgi:predicted PurR-regulated permease PerM
MNSKPWSLPTRYLVLGLLIILGFAGLWYIRSVLQPLVIAAFIAYVITPAVNYLTQHTKLSRRAAVNLVFSITIVFVLGIPASMTSLFFAEIQQVISDIMNMINQIIVWLSTARTFAGMNFNFSQAVQQLVQFRSTMLTPLTENALMVLEQTSLGALWFLVVLVAIYYFLANWPNLRTGFIESFPKEYQSEIEQLYQRVRAIWMNYLRGQLLLMLIVGIVFTLAWAIIGIPGALVLGIAAGLFTLIPDVGPFLAVVLAAGVALLEGSDWWPSFPHFAVMLVVVAVYLVLISIKNFWLRPFIMGRSVHMPEPLVFICIILATILWGIIGALLVIPMVVSLAIIFDYLRRRAFGMAPFPDAAISETKIKSPRTGPRSGAASSKEKS